MSSTSSNNFFYFLISFTLLLQTTFCKAEKPIYLCSDETFSASGPYGDNLSSLLNFLNRTTPPTGFNVGLFPRYDDPNQVSGLALCRGDVSTADCKTCVREAISFIHSTCPFRKQGMIWFDNCGLKYSDKETLGHIDNGNMFCLYNQVQANNTLFNQKVKELFKHMLKDPVKKPLYWSRDLDVSPSLTLYGMAQCTRDLNISVCKKCLKEIFTALRRHCYGRIGARIVTGSCTFRYEIYKFLNA